MKKYTLLAILLSCLSVTYNVALAQKSISLRNIQEVKVDELSDDQIKMFLVELKNAGYSPAQLPQLAAQRKMPTEEIDKLLGRINKIENPGSDAGSSQQSERTLNDDAALAKDKTDQVFKSLEKQVFGAELFNNKNLTFEPNIKIPTPANYVLATDDELIIDVYGFSEATYRLKVSPEGSIRIPNIGPVQVSGNTIEAARRKITSKLVSIYSGIGTGETGVNITLGAIRSIKVIILGEVNLPGTYTLPSLATVFNALYASGGPNKNGSFRNIKVIRNGKVIAVVDVYDFLLKGESKSNIRLNDQDVIKVSPYQNRIELTGEVKRPAYYEVGEKETLKDVIQFAGGFTDEAYRTRVKVIRNGATEKSVADVPNEMFTFFLPQSGDVFEVGKLLDRFSNRVIIRGAVFRPGYYSLEPGMTISGLIKKADGLKEDAFLNRAIVYRLKDDNSLEILSFNLGEILKGVGDFILKREDVIEINSKLELKEQYNFTIKGEVLRPGTYPYADNASVEDLIIAAGGIKESGSRKKIEIARRVSGKDGVVNTESSEIISVEINEDLKSDKPINLMPYDIVSVFSLPGYTTQKMVLIEGEVLYPGEYAIASKKERISTLIKRAGGVNPSGFLEGAVLIRTKKFTKAEEIIFNQKLESIKKEAKDSARLQEIINNELSNRTSIVGINLKKILENPGSRFDLFLEEGDLISIPTERQTIKVSGEVLYPVRIPYQKGRRFGSYVNGSGGYSQKALKRRGYVVYANGIVKSTRNYLIFKVHPKIKPGSEIIIPPQQERRKVALAEIVGVTSGLSTIALLIFTIINANNSGGN